MPRDDSTEEAPAPPVTRAPRITVAGIGASAGGIEALRDFFDAVPIDLGVAYVVIVHLSPNHNSELASIIGRRTKMPVMEVNEEKLELKTDHVYVISPEHKLEISDTRIGATPFPEPYGRRTAAEVHLETLETLAPPSVLVDDQWSVEHLSDSAGRYLQPRGGPPTQTLTELVRPELVDELRSALHRAFELREPCLSTFVPVRFNGTPQLVGMLVQPRPREEGREQHALVVFLESGKAEPGESGERLETSDSIVLGLRDKLRIAEQRLETMRQEHGLAYEDLRAANEELQSLNEEYRSTTEELETSKEELQSVNEELQTVNHELKMKLEEVSRANNDLENFMAATDIPMLFLDRSLGIKRYTAPLKQIFNIKSHDQGRPIGDLTHNMEYQDLERDAERVLHELMPIERQVKLRTDESLVVRIRPYRTAEDKIDGVVVTFVKPLGA